MHKIDDATSVSDDCVAQEESLNAALKQACRQVVKPVATRPNIHAPPRQTSAETPIAKPVIKTSLEHLRIGTAISSDQDSEEEDDKNGNFFVNGMLVDLGTMENGSVANQEIPNFVLLDEDEKHRPFHSRQPSHDMRMTEVLPPNPDLEYSHSVVD